MCRILVVEDNNDVNLMLCEALSGSGYAADSAFTGTEGLEKAKSGGFDLLLLDIMLPYKSGDAVLSELRRTCDIPVIIISAKDMVGTKVDLLRLGADDYITKPFDLDEVVARVESNLRRWGLRENKNSVLTFGALALDDGAKRAAAAGKPLDLTAKEYALLALFLKNKDKVFTKSNIYESIWNEEYLGDDSAVKTHISNLRAKLKSADPNGDYIETVWGLGYRLRQNPTQS